MTRQPSPPFSRTEKRTRSPTCRSPVAGTSKVRIFVATEIGGATGQLSCIVARAHPHMTALSCDLPVVTPIAEEIPVLRRLNECDLEDRAARPGESYSGTLTLRNDGTADLALGEVSLPGGFALVQGAGTAALAPGAAS